MRLARCGLIIGDPMGDRMGDSAGALLTILLLSARSPRGVKFLFVLPFLQSALSPGDALCQSCAPYVSSKSASMVLIRIGFAGRVGGDSATAPAGDLVAEFPPSTSLLACAPSDGPALNFRNALEEVTGLDSMMKPVLVDCVRSVTTGG